MLQADIEVLGDPCLELPNALDRRPRGNRRQDRLVAIVVGADAPRPSERQLKLIWWPSTSQSFLNSQVIHLRMINLHKLISEWHLKWGKSALTPVAIPVCLTSDRGLRRAADCPVRTQSSDLRVLAEAPTSAVSSLPKEKSEIGHISKNSQKSWKHFW